MKPQPLFQGYISVSPELAPNMLDYIPERLNQVENKIFYCLANTDNDAPSVKDMVKALKTDISVIDNDNLYFDNLIGGETYIVLIQDANLCPGDVVIPIEIGVDLSAEPEVVYGCDGIFPNSTSTVNMVDTSLIPDLLFALDPVDPTDAIMAEPLSPCLII